jgi:tRNA pseudouridine38-40 synthase
MARYQVTIAYDGTCFQGFQRQGGRARTVQAEIEAALERLGWSGSAILYAGRTDAGVHAAGQVIAFDLEWTHSDEALRHALNAYLPEDVAVKAVREVSPHFHPRYHAVGRAYTYRLYVAQERDPLRDRYAWRVWPDVDVPRMQAAARWIEGQHDFAAFGAPMKPGRSTVRRVYRASWEVLEDASLRFRIVANAFLYHMVRRLVYIQVLVGQAKLPPEAIGEALRGERDLPPGLAAARGLVLERVYYPEDGQGFEPLGESLTASGDEDCG